MRLSASLPSVIAGVCFVIAVYLAEKGICGL